MARAPGAGRGAGAVARERRVDRRDAPRSARVGSTARTSRSSTETQRLTVDDLREQSGRVAARLRQLNVLPGTMIVVLAAPELVGSRRACAGRSGAAARSSARSHRRCAPARSGFILRQSGARMAIVPPRIPRHRLSARCVREHRIRGRRDGGARRRMALPSADAAARDVAADPDDRRRHPVDVGHDRRIRRASCTRTSACAPRPTRSRPRTRCAPDEPLLLPMPVTHVAGLTYGVLLPVTSGITAVLMDTWEPGRALELVERERIAVMISTPVFMRTMIDHPAIRDTDTSSVRLFSLGGAGVAPAMVREGARELRTAGASAPTAPPSTRRSRPGSSATIPNATRPPTAGSSTAPSCASSIRRRCVDVAPGELGELLARGPEMFVGYLDPELDTDAFVDDGWFRTGDLARYDGDVPHDRRPPQGRDHPRRRERLGARGRGAARDAPERRRSRVRRRARPGDGRAGVRVRDRRAPARHPCSTSCAPHLLEHGLARFKLPSRLEVRDDLPRTASGKVQKAPLRDEIRAQTPV